MTLRIQLGCSGAEHPYDRMIIKCYDCCGGSPGEYDVPDEWIPLLVEALSTLDQERVIDQIEAAVTVTPCPIRGARRYMTYTVYGSEP